MNQASIPAAAAYAIAIAVAVASATGIAPAAAQITPGGPGGRARPSQMPEESAPEPTAEDKPDAAATKAYKAGLKSLAKAAEYAAAAPGSVKAQDAYYRALDQFTEALRNKGDMVDAWNKAGYVHLRLSAYGEAVDDYNHALALKPDLIEATLHRAQACLGLSRLEDARRAYMDLFNHQRAAADELMVSMQSWLTEHRREPGNVRAADIDAFGKWVEEREGIARQAASLSP